MAGNFWQSSHYQQWLLDKQDLLRERQSDLKVLSEEDYQKIMIFFANFIQALGEQLKVRQQVIATATVYFKRFYARNSLKSIDPWLMAPTCIFLASKVEEFGVISNSRLVTTCQTVVKNKFSHAYPQEYPYRISNVLECEFYLLEMMVMLVKLLYILPSKSGPTGDCIDPDLPLHNMPEDLGLCSLLGIISRTSNINPDLPVHYAMADQDCCLVVYHPYRPLTQFVSDFSTTDDSILALAWRIVNDSLRTDVCLLYPPYMIALAALHIACVIQQKDLKSWFAELSVDMDKILEITKQILKLYELWKNYDEKKEIAAVLNNMPKARTSPTPPPNQGASDGSQPAQTSQST